MNSFHGHQGQLYGFKKYRFGDKSTGIADTVVYNGKEFQFQVKLR